MEEIYKTALRAAIAGSIEIIQVYNNDFETIIKEDGSPLTKADLASSLAIHKLLDPLGIPITGEETTHLSYEIRKHWIQCWCIDPLDGTKEFIKKNDEFAVNIAHIVQGKPIFGIIAAPVSEKLLFGGTGIGVYKCAFKDLENRQNWQEIKAKSNVGETLRMIGSRSHGTGPLADLLETLQPHFTDIQFATKGSSLKFFDLAEGTAHIYPRFAPTMEWDIAAGQAIIEALGGEVINHPSGEPLSYNKENLLNPYFVVRSKALLTAMA
jgi:3'(2'), 5'-bisphosphate nucleotidase